MRTTKNLLGLPLLCVVLTSGAQPNSSPELLIDAWVKMWNTYNLSLVDQLFVADQSVTYFSSEYTGLIRGIEALRNHHAGFGFVQGRKQSENKLWLKEEQYYRNAQTCLVTATWFFQRAGSAQYQAGAVTFLLVKSKGNWKIKHAHFSNNP